MGAPTVHRVRKGCGTALENAVPAAQNALPPVRRQFADASRAETARARNRRRAILTGAFAILAAAVVVLVQLNATAREQLKTSNEKQILSLERMTTELKKEQSTRMSE